MSTATQDLPRYANHIGGQSAPSATGRTFTAINPTTGRPWGEFADSGAADVDAAVQAAAAAFRGPWANCRRRAAGGC